MATIRIPGGDDDVVSKDIEIFAGQSVSIELEGVTDLGSEQILTFARRPADDPIDQAKSTTGSWTLTNARLREKLVEAEDFRYFIWTVHDGELEPRAHGRFQRRASIEPALAPLVATAPEPFAFAAGDTPVEISLAAYFSGGAGGRAYEIVQNDAPDHVTLDGAILTVDGAGYQAIVEVRATDTTGATAEVTIEVEVGAATAAPPQFEEAPSITAGGDGNLQWTLAWDVTGADSVSAELVRVEDDDSETTLIADVTSGQVYDVSDDDFNDARNLRLRVTAAGMGVEVVETAEREVDFRDAVTVDADGVLWTYTEGDLDFDFTPAALTAFVGMAKRYHIQDGAGAYLTSEAVEIENVAPALIDASDRAGGDTLRIREQIILPSARRSIVVYSNTIVVEDASAPANEDPVAAEDAATVTVGESVTLDPRENDGDPDGDPLTIIAASITSGGGSVSVSAEGDSITVTADSGAEAGTPIVVGYTISDGVGGTASGEVTLTIEAADPVGDPTTTTMQTSVTDAETGIEYHFVDASGEPEQREVGQYRDGKWFVLGGAGNPVRIGRMVPEAEIVSTSAWTRPDANPGWEAWGSSASDRVINGAEVNPNQGEVKPRFAAYDSYLPEPAKNNIPYDHSRNIDPGVNGGAPVVREEGSVVKSVSRSDEPGTAADPSSNKSMVAKWTVLTVVPEVPVANAFRPPVRGTDKRSYWNVDMIDWSHRKIIPGFRPYSVSELQAQNARRKHLQPTFVFADEENTRRWNPGSHGHGFDVYGTGWYRGWHEVFECFHGDYTQEEIEEAVCATIQAGLDLYGHQTDGAYISGHYAHHSGRKGLVHMAGLLLGDQDILEIITYSDTNNRFGVDDGMTGYIEQAQIDRSNHIWWNSRQTFMPKYGQEWLGRPDWTSYFAPFDGPNVSRQLTEHLHSPDLNLEYRVQTQERTGGSAVYQVLWAMIADPDAEIWNPAHFDYIDRYVSIRAGDGADGAWDTRSADNGIFWGNWENISGTAQTYQNWLTIRQNSSRPRYFGPAETLPSLDVVEVATGLEITLKSDNDFRCPQDKDAAIVDYDLRWVAYPDDALSVTDPSSDNRLFKMEWRVEESIQLDTETPYLLTGVPGGYRIVLQARMNNVHGKGAWIDYRYMMDYGGGRASDPEDAFAPDGYEGATANRWIEKVDVSAALARTPMCWRQPTITPNENVQQGDVLSTEGGYWTGNPTRSYVWEKLQDGTWSQVGTGTTYTVQSGDAGVDAVRVTVSGSSAEGAGETSTSEETTGVPGDSILEYNVVAAGTGTPAYSDAAGFAGRTLMFIRGHAWSGAPIPTYADGTEWERRAYISNDGREVAVYMTTYSPEATETEIFWANPEEVYHWAVIEFTEGTPKVVDLQEQGITSGDAEQFFSLPAPNGGAAFAVGSSRTSTDPEWSAPFSIIPGTANRGSGIYEFHPTISPSVDYSITVSNPNAYGNNRVITLVLRSEEEVEQNRPNPLVATELASGTGNPSYSDGGLAGRTLVFQVAGRLGAGVTHTPTFGDGTPWTLIASRTDDGEYVAAFMATYGGGATETGLSFTDTGNDANSWSLHEITGGIASVRGAPVEVEPRLDGDITAGIDYELDTVEGSLIFAASSAQSNEISFSGDITENPATASGNCVIGHPAQVNGPAATITVTAGRGADYDNQQLIAFVLEPQ